MLQQLQEIAVILRGVADIRRLFVYNSLHAVTWGRANAPRIQGRGSDKDVARVFELTNPQTLEQLQEFVTLLRSVADVMRLFFYIDRRSVAVRATVQRVALAAWLVSQLDKPANDRADTQTGTASRE